jgi:hypothetical protein
LQRVNFSGFESIKTLLETGTRDLVQKTLREKEMTDSSHKKEKLNITKLLLIFTTNPNQ